MTYKKILTTTAIIVTIASSLFNNFSLASTQRESVPKSVSIYLCNSSNYPVYIAPNIKMMHISGKICEDFGKFNLIGQPGSNEQITHNTKIFRTVPSYFPEKDYYYLLTYDSRREIKIIEFWERKLNFKIPTCLKKIINEYSKVNKIIPLTEDFPICIKTYNKYNDTYDKEHLRATNIFLTYHENNYIISKYITLEKQETNNDSDDDIYK